MNWLFKMIGAGMVILEIRNNLVWISRGNNGRYLEIPSSFLASLLIADHYTCTDQRAVILYRKYMFPVPEEDRQRASLTGVLWSIGALACMIWLLTAGTATQISCFLITVAWVEIGTILSIHEKKSWMERDIYRRAVTSGIVLAVLFTALAWLMMRSNIGVRQVFPEDSYYL